MTAHRPTYDTDYDRYIHTAELLALSKPVHQLANHDELLFQGVHQAMEVWFNIARHEVVKATRLIDGDDLHRAAHHLRRIHMIVNHLSHGLPILETLAQADYHEIRLALGRGSGQDSPGFNHMLEMLPSLWTPFARAIERHNVALLDVFAAPHEVAHAALFAVAQALLDVDRGFQHFRYEHLQLARREIGLAVKSLKGVPARNLEQGVLRALYPELWTVIEELTVKTNPIYGG
jgi:tryptophan 2,3-dioxygenase